MSVNVSEFSLIQPSIFYAQVHIRDKMFVIHCGAGEQKVRWLADVAMHRYDADYCWDVASSCEIRVNGGAQVRLDRQVADALKRDEHVTI